MLEIVEVLRSFCFLLGQPKFPQPDEVHRHDAAAHCDACLGARLPGAVERHRAQARNQIDPVRWSPELDDEVGIGEFSGVTNRRHGSAPELDQSTSQTVRIVQRTVVQEIDFTGEPRVSVVDHGSAADHQVPHLVLGQQPKEVLRVL
ncbi:MAG: hypothetical protein JNK15_17605 [Planctomycetes bacterium]|nr:hypothetical protein [Planctomycetota bacterium]